jgi:hypothetical protein
MKPTELTSTARKSSAMPTTIPPTNQTKPVTRAGARKKKSTFTKPKKGGLSYDGKGKLRGTKEDLCDCFDDNCVGCHFGCEICGSQKCGNVCRRYRGYIFEVIEYDGKSKIEMNRNFKATVSQK